MRWRELVAAVAAAGLSLLLLPGCAAIPFLGKSASQLAANASQEWTKAPAHEIAGTLVANGSPISVDVTVSTKSNGDGTGSGRFAGNPFQFLDAGGKAYLRGQSFWQAYYGNDQDQQTPAKGFEDRWTLASDNDVAGAIQHLGNLGALAAELGGNAHEVKKGSDTTIGGQRAAPLTAAGTTWWVTESDPPSIVKVEATQALGMSDVTLFAAARSTVHAAVPGSGAYADPNDPTTLPAYYEVDGDSNDPSACDQNGCPLTITISNHGGQPEGQSVVEDDAYSDSDAPITSCDAPIPAIPSGQQGTVTCTLNGGAWSAFVTAGNTHFYTRPAIKSNPPYVT